MATDIIGEDLADVDVSICHFCTPLNRLDRQNTRIFLQIRSGACAPILFA